MQDKWRPIDKPEQRYTHGQDELSSSVSCPCFSPYLTTCLAGWKVQVSPVVVRCKHCRPSSTCTYGHTRVRNALFAQSSSCGVDIFHTFVWTNYSFIISSIIPSGRSQACSSTEQGSHKALKQSQTLTIPVTTCTIRECQVRPNPLHLRSQCATILPKSQPEIGFNLCSSQLQ